MSNTTKQLLDKFPGYNVESRGEIEVKVSRSFVVDTQIYSYLRKW